MVQVSLLCKLSFILVIYSSFSNASKLYTEEQKTHNNKSQVHCQRIKELVSHIEPKSDEDRFEDYIAVFIRHSQEKSYENFAQTYQNALGFLKNEIPNYFDKDSRFKIASELLWSILSDLILVQDVMEENHYNQLMTKTSFHLGNLLAKDKEYDSAIEMYNLSNVHNNQSNVYENKNPLIALINIFSLLKEKKIKISDTAERLRKLIILIDFAEREASSLIKKLKCYNKDIIKG